MDSELPLSPAIALISDSKRGEDNPFWARGFLLVPRNDQEKAFCTAFLANWKRSEPAPIMILHIGESEACIKLKCEQAVPRLVSIPVEDNDLLEALEWLLMIRYDRAHTLVTTSQNGNLRVIFPEVDIINPGIIRFAETTSDICRVEVSVNLSEEGWSQSSLEYFSKQWGEGRARVRKFPRQGLVSVSASTSEGMKHLVLRGGDDLHRFLSGCQSISFHPVGGTKIMIFFHAPGVVEAQE